MTEAWQKFLDYIGSFGIDTDKINIRTITTTGYDAWMDHNGTPIPIFRPWPSAMDVPYLFRLGMAALESEEENGPESNV